MAWCFEDEADVYADWVHDSLTANGALVPPLWATEVANVLATGERRGRITSADSRTFLAMLAQSPIVIDDRPPMDCLPDILSLARDHGLTAYDAAYLELAMRSGCPLATLDDALLRAAEAVGVPRFAGPEPSDA
jgi:predicted nucleic acid-binding protein